MSDRVVISTDPLNAETSLADHRGPRTPSGLHYVRSHFAFPDPPTDLALDGAVRHTARFDLAQLQALPSRTFDVTLECAGNGRSALRPTVPGEQWGIGAVSTAGWTGVSLTLLLDRAEVLPAAVELLFRGADAGLPKDVGRRISFERSLPVADARDPDVIVAYAMNGGPIPREHGAPFRLIVPGRYGMASVKWLAGVTAITEPFAGFYQRDRYVVDGRPLPPVVPRAVIVEPRDGAAVARGRLAVRGYAWAAAGVASVELSLDGGGSWRPATLGSETSAHAWREFSAAVEVGTETTLLARATDRRGAAQPLEQRWNELGYLNNGARPVRVAVR